MNDSDLTLVFIIILGIVISLAIYIPFLLNLSNLLKQVQPSNRLREPNNVWLMLIPIFSMIYAFFLYPKISDSVKAEYEYRGLPSKGDFSRSLAIAIAVLPLVGFIPVLGGIAGVGNLVVFIIFWVKMAQYKKELISSPSEKGGGIGASEDLLDN